MTSIYFARPLDQAHEHSTVLVDRVVFNLAAAGYLFFQPGAAWCIGGDLSQADRLAIASVNEAAQRACDVTVAVLPDGVPTLGTPSEVERALQWGKPTVLVVGRAVAKTVQAAEWCREGALILQDADAVRDYVRAALVAAHEKKAQGEHQLGVKLEGGRIPTRSHAGDAGFDLYATQFANVQPGEYVEIATDVRLALPPNTWGLLVGRSSTARKNLVVNQAIIDNGYTGPMYFGVHNVGVKDVNIHVGDRIAQIIPMPLLAANMPVVEISEMPATDRGDAGFGSTGN